jgi:hypothetical protein
VTGVQTCALPILEETFVTLVPDPVVVRGAGNMTV